MTSDPVTATTTDYNNSDFDHSDVDATILQVVTSVIDAEVRATLGEHNDVYSCGLHKVFEVNVQ